MAHWEVWCFLILSENKLPLKVLPPRKKENKIGEAVFSTAENGFSKMAGRIEF